VLCGCTNLACTQLDVLNHYYPDYTVLDFEPDFHDEFETEISKASMEAIMRFCSRRMLCWLPGNNAWIIRPLINIKEDLGHKTTSNILKVDSLNICSQKSRLRLFSQERGWCERLHKTDIWLPQKRGTVLHYRLNLHISFEQISEKGLSKLLNDTST
jgi:hypothetical protein